MNEKYDDFSRSGFYISAAVEPSVLDQLVTEDYLLNSVPEIEDEILYLHYSYLAIVKDKESLKSVLESRDKVISEYSSLYFSRNISVTVYESLIASIFSSCPSNKKSICPRSKNEFLPDQKENFWVNTPRGKAAVSLLSMLPPMEILGKKKVHENKNGNLNQQIKCVLNYIKRNEVDTTDECNFNYLLSFMKEQMWVTGEGVPLYDFIGQNYPLIKDDELTASNLIRKDFACSVHRCILAIASYQDCDDVAATNRLIKNLMLRFNLNHIVNQVHGMLKDNLDGVINIKLLCGNIGNAVLQRLSMDDNKGYTGKELIKHAREYLVKRYVPQISMIMERSVPIRIGPIERMVSIYGMEKECQLSSSLSLNQVVTPDIPLQK